MPAGEVQSGAPREDRGPGSLTSGAEPAVGLGGGAFRCLHLFIEILASGLGVLTVCTVERRLPQALVPPGDG